MTTLPNTRAATIAAEIGKALSGVIAADDVKRDAAKEQQGASERAIGAREAALLSLAAIAEQGKWSKREIEGGTAEALDRRNRKDASIATFASEIKRACHPLARSHAPKLSELCAEAWEAEGATEKGHSRPCRKAFARRYHMLVASFGEAIDGRVLASRQEVVGWATARDPDRDPSKVLARVQSMQAALHALAVDWPHGELATCNAALGRITLSSLSACRKASAAVPETPQIAEPAEGASDILDDALGGLLVAA
jgi:hypothetical protein